jgi:hypothetical protein
VALRLGSAKPIARDATAGSDLDTAAGSGTIGSPRKTAPLQHHGAAWPDESSRSTAAEGVGRRAPGRGLPKAGGRALAPARGAAQRRLLDLSTALFGNVGQDAVHRAALTSLSWAGPALASARVGVRTVTGAGHLTFCVYPGHQPLE